MREGAVGVGHAVRILALLHGIATVVGRIHQLTRKARGHRCLGPAASGGDQPADSKRLSAFRTNLDGHLVRGAAHTPRTHLDLRGDVVERIVEQRDRIGLRAAFNGFERAIDDALGNRLLTV